MVLFCKEENYAKEKKMKRNDEKNEQIHSCEYNSLFYIIWQINVTFEAESRKKIFPNFYLIWNEM